MHKIILILSIFTSVTVHADAMPSHFSLPDEGKNCSLVKAYVEKPITCGSNKIETWTCITPSENTWKAPGKSTEYALIIKYKSDVSSDCSPTPVVEKVVPQK